MTFEKPDSVEGVADTRCRRTRRGEAMVAAARALFLEKGFDAVSLGEIVRHSRGSLSTLYAVFGNKQGLLAAVVDAERFEGLERLRATLDATDEAPADILFRIACDLIDALLERDVIGLMRLVTAEGIRSPAFARSIQSAAHEPLVAALTQRFATWHRDGRATFPAPYTAAALFMSLFFYAPQMKALFLDPDTRRQPTYDRYFRSAVTAFMAGAAVLPPEEARDAADACCDAEDQVQ